MRGCGAAPLLPAPLMSHRPPPNVPTTFDSRSSVQPTLARQSLCLSQLTSAAVSPRVHRALRGMHSLPNHPPALCSFHYITPDVIVGSQPRNALDVEQLAAEGVNVILSLQQVRCVPACGPLAVGRRPSTWRPRADAASGVLASPSSVSQPPLPQLLAPPLCRTRTWPTGRSTCTRFRPAPSSWACAWCAPPPSTSRRTRCARRCRAVSRGRCCLWVGRQS